MLEVRNLEVTYKNVIVGVKDISLSVPDKGIVAFLGSNGAGKTTTIRAVTGLAKLNGGRITKGHIYFNGQETTTWSPQAIAGAGIMQVPEGRRVFHQLTTEENLAVGSSTNRVSNKERQNLADKIYEYFPKLHDRRKSKAGYLSGGEQQMLAIGRALMAQPKLLVIDELSLGLAPVIIWDLARKLIDIRRDEGISVLLVEQNARLALAIAQYGYVVESGAITKEGPTEILKNDSLVKNYLGNEA